jgi:hypothetical protein
MRHIINDKEFGEIKLRVNTRTNKLIAHVRDGVITITTPPFVDCSGIVTTIDEHREQLRKLVKNAQKQVINIDFRIETDLFKLNLKYGDEKMMTAYSEIGKMEIVCPKGLDFDNADIQHALRATIVEGMRNNAKAIFPERLYALSERYNLPFNAMRISSSRGRWGSCSSNKTINLSLYNLLLPNHLIDYVMLHELCHTREMNHSTAFWKLLNSMTDNRAFALRDELKGYQPNF